MAGAEALVHEGEPSGGLDAGRRATWFAVTVAVGTSMLALAGVGAALLEEPFTHLSRDPASTLDAPPSVGAVSTAGIVLWGAAATAIFIGWVVLPRHRRPPLAAGLLTTFLLVDDALMLHDRVLPRVGISQEPVYVVELFVAAVVLVSCVRRRPRSLELLVLAGLALVSSVAVDWIWSGGERDVVEDSLKLFGIVAWASYWLAWIVDEATRVRDASHLASRPRARLGGARRSRDA